jgi:hypothetical protein
MRCQTFPARASALAGIQAFVDCCLTQSALPRPEPAVINAMVTRVLLNAAGPGGQIQVSVRILPACVEVDVLRPSPAGLLVGVHGDEREQEMSRRERRRAAAPSAVHRRVRPGAGLGTRW